MRRRRRPRLGSEVLERRDLLTVSFDMGPSAAWVEQIARFNDLSLADIDEACGPSACDTLAMVHRYDGTGNNEANPTWGAIHEPLARVGAPDYADGIGEPGGLDRPNPRTISNEVAAQEELGLSQTGLSNLVWIWGQFLDHDITLTPSNPDEQLNISIPPGDPDFDPMGTGMVELSFTRSLAAEGSGESADNPRIQINEITAFIDGSSVYGSDAERANALRSFSGGRLKTSESELLPYNIDGLPNDGGTSPTMFLAGDVRANENVALTSMHTIWMREHNLRAAEISEAYPDWNDEQIYQYARAIVTSEIQAITYNEFLPAILGNKGISTYTGYDESANPTISNLFAGATYRLGHSMLSEDLMRMDKDHEEMPEGPMPLRSAFFAPHEVTSETVDVVMQGAAHQLSRHIDTQMVDSVRNFLFGPPGAGGFDLAALNIQRGRDLGLADYNSMRVALGLERVELFTDITSDILLAAKLESLYGSVDTIDPWVGALAEDHVPGAAVGELIYTSLVNQFESIRNGDRLWYENRFSGMLRQQLRRTTLSEVIRRTTDVGMLQENVFFATQSLPQRGDVTGDFRVNVDDLYGLSAALERGATDEMYDVTGDGQVDGADSLMLATEILGLHPGDATGNGSFNPSDLIAMFQSGEYEDDIVGNSTWIEGDFNGDLEFDSADMILAMQSGNYVADGANVVMARKADAPAGAASRNPGVRLTVSAPSKADLVAAIDSVFESDGDKQARTENDSAPEVQISTSHRRAVAL